MPAHPRSTSRDIAAIGLTLAAIAVPGFVAAHAQASASATQATAGPTVTAAPGRIVFPVAGDSVRNDVDAGGATLATALPDGSTLMFGPGAAGSNVLYAAKVGLGGALDRDRKSVV